VTNIPDTKIHHTVYEVMQLAK